MSFLLPPSLAFTLCHLLSRTAQHLVRERVMVVLVVLVVLVMLVVSAVLVVLVVSAMSVVLVVKVLFLQG